MFVTASSDPLVAGVRTLIASLTAPPVAANDGVRVDRIRALEELKSAVAAAQARETAAFAASQRIEQAAAGVPGEQVGRGIAAQVGLAGRISPFHAQRYVGWATVLTRELPGTFTALQAGRCNEWRAMIVARETAWLSKQHRAAVDRDLAARLEQLGDRQVEAEAKKLAYRLDPHGFVERIRQAANDRRVTLRPAPDTMARLTALLPVAQGVAAYAALTRATDTATGTATGTAAGDGRSRGQVMADTLVERLTGQTTAAEVPVEINLVMTDQTLLDGGDEPAHLDRYGPIPAVTARELAHAPGGATPMWLRRLFTRPGSGELVAMETRRRAFTAGQRRFLRLRDQHCRTPWCDAPIRHTDHVLPVAHGGTTSIGNGQGYCQACNHAKQAPSWTAHPQGLEVVTVTPTGHRYRSRPPDPPGTRTPTSPVEQRLADRLRRAA